MKIILLLSLVVASSFAAETRIKVGFNRWAFNINSNDGKTRRTEYTDETGVSHGLIILSSNNEEAPLRELRYKFSRSGDDPDFTFISVSPNETENMLPFPDVNFESIGDDQEFGGHVILKVGKSDYALNFVTGDKKQTREETLDDEGLLNGKFSYFDDKRQSRMIVNYQVNNTGSEPTFEVKMFKKSEKPSIEAIILEFNANQLQQQQFQQHPNRGFMVPARHHENVYSQADDNYFGHPVAHPSLNSPFNIVSPNMSPNNHQVFRHSK